MCKLNNFGFQDTVSVHRPSFYAQRFQEFMAKKVFKKIPSRKYHLYYLQHISTICFVIHPKVYVFFIIHLIKSVFTVSRLNTTSHLWYILRVIFAITIYSDLV